LRTAAVTDVEVIADRASWVVVTFAWEVEGDRSGADTVASLARPTESRTGRSEAHFRWMPEQALQAAGLSE
jgi:hypothetical protein